MGYAETNCRQVVEQLYRFIDGEISADICASIEAHLRACHPCMDHVSFERDLKALVRRKCGEGAPPADLAERLKAQLAHFLESQ